MPDGRVPTTALCLVLLKLSFGFFATVAYGADAAAEYDQRIWQKQDGLPDNQVQCLLQTRNGYLWIGTRKGLARFDGLKFTVFNRANTPSLENDDVRRLAEDARGNLWISTRSELLRFGTFAFRRFGAPDGICGGAGYAPYASKAGGLWITSHGSLTRFRDGKVNCYEVSDGLLSEISSLQEDGKGVLWVGQRKALQRFDPQTTTFSTNLIPQQLGNTTVDNLQ